VVAAGDAAEPKEIPMRKQTSKTHATLRSNSRKTEGRSSPTQIAAQTKLKASAQPPVGQQQRSPEKQMGRPDSKRARIIEILRTPSGATIEAMTRATGWQQHSLRGFLAGVVRKKLGLNLVSTAAKGGRVYRIADRADAHVAAAKATRAA
jgi:hypothetical protein